MRDALSILASSTAVPPSPTPPRHHQAPRRHPSSAGPASKARSKPNAKPRPNSTTSSPLVLSSRRHNRQSLRYNAELASKLLEEVRFDDFIMIAENVISSGVSASEFVAMLDAKNVASGIARMVGEGKFDAFLEGARSLGIEPLEMCDGAVLETIRGECRGLLDRGDVARLASLLETLAGFQFRIKELVEPSEVINLCIIKRDPTAAIRCMQVFPHAEILFCSIILEFGKKSDLESALTAFEESKKNMISPNMHVYRTVIDVCGRCGDYLKSRTIYEELLAGGITPNTFVVNSLMNVNASDLSYTLHIYKQMEKLGVTADITSRNILLKSCSLSRNVQLAQEIYREMRKLEVEGALKLDVFTYSTMIKVVADFKMWKVALKVKEDMMASGVVPNTFTWSSLISACANAGVVDQATKLFDEMLEAGGQPNALCVNSLLHACVEARQFDRAFRLFESWKENSFQQANLDENKSNSNAAFAQMGVLYKSSSHLTRKVPFRPTISTYNILMKACGTDYYRVKALMDEMKTLGLSPNHISWSILMDICGAAGNVMGAVQILRSMRETGIQPDVIAYTTAIKICVEHNNPKLAYSVFAEMEKYQIKPNMVTFNTILRARRRYGSLQEVQQCLAIYQRMRKAGYKPNDHYLKQLIEEWCEGVMHNEYQNKSRLSSSTTDFRPQSLLLEKVAEHLHESNAESFSINLRGLSKLEARIVVLAVLRKIKEMYAAGSSVKDDLLIILGLQELGAIVAKEDNGVKEAIIRLLQHDLGLQIFSLGSRTMNDVSIDDPRQTSESPTRRPVVLQRLKVTKESLHRWLQRKIDSSTP